MTTITTETFVEYFIWVIMVFTLPSFVSAGVVTSITNSKRARSIFENFVEIVHLKITVFIQSIEKIGSPKRSEPPKNPVESTLSEN